MKNKNDIDIVDKIIDHLRSMEELPYREGAWERFRNTKLKKKKNFSPMWAAALLCLLGAFAGFWLLDRQETTETPQLGHIEQSPVEAQSDILSSESNVERATVDHTIGAEAGVDQAVTESPWADYRQPIQVAIHEEQSSIVLSQPSDIHHRTVALPDLIMSSQRMTILSSHEPKIKQHPVSLENHILAQDHHTMTVQTQEVDGRDKQFKLNDKFSLGLVVSPSRTDQRMNFGGGLLLSYNIGERLSIRTGATFHQYEVGILKDPVQSVSMEIAKAPDRPLQAENVYYSERNSLQKKSSMALAGMPLIPNVNAVTGHVQTIDIPLEAKYTVYKGFYAGAGVSYAAVLNQKRYAHYVENVNVDPYAKGLPANEAEMKSAVQPVTQTVESATPNVNTSGFGGFVNMSLGKEMKMGKSVSLSLEPYVKLPVGSFKHADMNYTNGGLRIITNF